MVLGESTTDALNSWVVILNYLLKQKRPGDNIKIVNNAVSGQTTTEALKRITTQVNQKPNWVLCFLGSNDCARYGDEGNKTNVSLTETLNNLSTIRNIVSVESPNTNFIWLAPAPINEKKASDFPPFKKMNLFLKNTDLLAVADSLKLKAEPVVDFRDVLGVPARSEFMQFDGAHYTIEGQILIAKHLLNNLAK
jgi:lysophospholipase L1-like esterase